MIIPDKTISNMVLLSVISVLLIRILVTVLFVVFKVFEMLVVFSHVLFLLSRLLKIDCLSVVKLL